MHRPESRQVLPVRAVETRSALRDPVDVLVEESGHEGPHTVADREPCRSSIDFWEDMMLGIENTFSSPTNARSELLVVACRCYALCDCSEFDNTRCVCLEAFVEINDSSRRSFDGLLMIARQDARYEAHDTVCVIEDRFGLQLLNEAERQGLCLHRLIEPSQALGFFDKSIESVIVFLQLLAALLLFWFREV